MNRKMITKPLACTVLLYVCASVASAQTSAIDTDQAEAASNSANFSFTGSSSRIGLGVDQDGDFFGEYFQVLRERDDSAVIGEAWMADDAGGLKLNYHWLSKSAAEGGTDKINKLFLSFDQNEKEDQKVSAGWGYEMSTHFAGAYLSKSLTGSREESSSTVSSSLNLGGIESGHAFSETLTTFTTTRIFEHAYDYGVGLRLGRFYDDKLLRIGGGLDYEMGEEDSRQYTATVNVEKFFRNSPHSISLSAQWARKSGDFEVDDSDAMVSAMWRYDFGQSFRPAVASSASAASQVALQPTPAPERKLVRNNITLDSNIFFGFDEAKLSDEALQTLAGIADRISGADYMTRIEVTGHTCNIGTEAYNQRLSMRRAEIVNSYFSSRGIAPDALSAIGMGELEPRYSNDTEESRRQNRRVDISYLAYEESWETLAAPATPGVSWEKEVVDSEPAWIQQALRNPVKHKRMVDYYRIEKEEVRTETGPRSYENNGPAAVDDSAIVEQDSAGFSIAVLSNDSDPDSDTLQLTSVTQPSNGSASVSGSQAVYTPNSGYNGSDEFSYTISDGFGGTASAKVFITVLPTNRAPTAVDDNAMGMENMSTDVEVLANDTDPDNDALIITSVTKPSMGDAVISGSIVVYTPMMDWFGDDSFTYTISDGRGGDSTATVNISVMAAGPGSVD